MTHRAVLLTGPAPRAPESRVSSRRAATPTGTQRDSTWYGIPGSVWPGRVWVSPPDCAPSSFLVKINPVLAEPSTAGIKNYWRITRL